MNLFQDGSTGFVNVERDPVKKISFLFRPTEKESFVLANLVVGTDNVTIAVQKQQVNLISKTFYYETCENDKIVCIYTAMKINQSCYLFVYLGISLKFWVEDKVKFYFNNI